MKKIITVLLCIVFICTLSLAVYADAATYDMRPAGYYVYVLTPDGGLNFRHGPGTEYPKVIEDTIPDYTELYIEYVSGNWGYTKYNGKYGWVALKQTTQTPPSSLDAVTNKKVAGYYVYVLTPDGGLNMRQGPGVNYAKSLDGIIPDYSKLYIEYTSNGWGYTEFMGTVGWVALNQTTTTPPPEKQTPADTKPADTEIDVPEKAETPINTEAPDNNIDDTNKKIAEEDAKSSAQPVNTTPDVTSDKAPDSSAPSYQIMLIASILLLTCAIAVVGIVLINKKSR